MRQGKWKELVKRRHIVRGMTVVVIGLCIGLYVRVWIGKKVDQWQHCLWGWNGSLSLQPRLELFTDGAFTDAELEVITPENAQDLVLLADLVGDSQAVSDIEISADSSLLAVRGTVEYMNGSSLVLRTCGTVWLWNIGSDHAPSEALIPSEIDWGGSVGFLSAGTRLYSSEQRVLLDDIPSIVYLLREFPGNRVLPYPSQSNVVHQYRVWETDNLSQSETSFSLAPYTSDRHSTYRANGIVARIESDGRGGTRALLWNSRTREQLVELETHSPFGAIIDIAFSPNGKVLVVVINFDAGGRSTVQIWGVPTDNQIQPDTSSNR